VLTWFGSLRRFWAVIACACLLASVASGCLNPRPDDLPGGNEAPERDGARLPDPNADDLGANTSIPAAPPPSEGASDEPEPASGDPDLLREAAAPADEGADAGVEARPSDAGPDAN
jgi:hypothetical protein